MSIKSTARRCGRMIRRLTGLHLTIAMKMGKLVAQGKQFELVNRFPAHVSMVKNCPCCGPETIIQGPKGSIQEDHITEERLRRELSIVQKLASVPFGTPISIP